ncbi:MAG: phosphoethanolamine transferase [Cytophagaceae bacterium]|jgi:glucan phosphoethanolaminetransferase (alkaline phosphatase superfamily)|nr:phosphoethanolamine transferase [Cytophagaceae bacterium]
MTFIKTHLFSILCTLYFYAIILYRSPGLTTLAWGTFNILSLLLIFNILAKTKYTLILTVLLGLLLSFDAFFSFVYSESLSIGAFASIMETNGVEAAGFMGDVYIKALVIAGLTLFLLIMAKRELKHSFLSRKVSVVLLLAYWISIPLFLYSIISFDIKKGGLHADSFESSPALVFANYSRRRMPLAYNCILVTVAYLHEMNVLKSFSYRERILPDGIGIGYTTSGFYKIYFILGESSCSDYYSLFDYPVQTTPFMDSLASTTPSQIYYSRAVAPAPITREALKNILSFATPSSPDLFFTKKNIIDLANDQGFETCWISTQPRVSLFDSYAGMIAKDAAYTEYNIGTKDMDLLPVLEQKTENGKKQFFVLHLNGSHLPYHLRFEEEDARAIPDGTLKEYECSIHYTDRFIQQLYSMALRDTLPSLIYYLSDHGEMPDEGGHGFIERDSRQFRVPLVMIHTSEHFRADSVFQKYADEQGRIATLNTPYMIAEILGCTVDAGAVSEAVESGKYIYHVDGNTYRFDELQK